MAFTARRYRRAVIRSVVLAVDVRRWCGFFLTGVRIRPARIAFCSVFSFT
jgi:hypothetical protein